MKFYVTQAHIDRGNCNRIDHPRRMERYCPLALCMQESGFPAAQVCEEEILPHGDVYSKIEVPDDVRQFVAAFDLGNRVHPSVFDIPVEPVHAD